MIIILIYKIFVIRLIICIYGTGYEYYKSCSTYNIVYDYNWSVVTDDSSNHVSNSKYKNKKKTRKASICKSHSHVHNLERYYCSFKIQYDRVLTS